MMKHIIKMRGKHKEECCCDMFLLSMCYVGAGLFKRVIDETPDTNIRHCLRWPCHAMSPRLLKGATLDICNPEVGLHLMAPLSLEVNVSECVTI